MSFFSFLAYCFKNRAQKWFGAFELEQVRKEWVS